jgi:hypothetical protein
MSRLSEFASKESAKRLTENSTYGALGVENFMGGTSYSLSPLNTLKIVAASSIFGEPQYYRDGLGSPKNLSTILEYSILSHLFKKESGEVIDNMSSLDIFENAIQAALDFDFKATLDLALELRNDYFMRLNPAVIFMKASMHEGRQEFNEKNPGYMKKIGKAIALRPDDLTNQFEYYMYKNGGKKGLSSLVKRTWAEKLAEFSRYQLNKYKSKSLIDLVRISHAKGEDINELMKTGKIEVTEKEKTWESLRSEGKTWKDITDSILIPHMALLRNLRGIFTEIEDRTIAARILAQLKSGVEKGKQFPFRYWSAYKAIKGAELHNKQMVLDALEECMDKSIENMPKLEGRVACLSDNSGSAWGSFNSEYGSVTVAEIANLSSIITALQSEEGIVGVFGDRLSLEGVSKRNGILTQLEETSKRGKQQGGGTENGIWIFWDEAIKNKIHYDTVFIYSDMQAGHGGLYGYPETVGKSPYGYRGKGSTHVDVLAMVQKYRETVNPKVNVFSVQVAGYNNSVIPENLYRGAILSGWTGKEPIFAKAIIEAWDSIESN